MTRNRYKQSYSDFIGTDISHDPKDVSRNRLAYSINMWRDYESEMGGCVETFPGYRTVQRLGNKINGLYHYRTRDGEEYLIAHCGEDLFAYKDSELAAAAPAVSVGIQLLSSALNDSDSTGFLFNNNLYILDGAHFIEVSNVLDESGAIALNAEEIVGYVPTTRFDGKPYEQRNLLSSYAYEIATSETYDNGFKSQLKYSIGNHFYESKKKTIYGYESDISEPLLFIDESEYAVYIKENAFSNKLAIKYLYITAMTDLVIYDGAFSGCSNLKSVNLLVNPDTRMGEEGYRNRLVIQSGAFSGCTSLETVNIYINQSGRLYHVEYDGAFDSSFNTSNVDIYDWQDFTPPSTGSLYSISVEITELAKDVVEVRDRVTDTVLTDYGLVTKTISVNDEEIDAVTHVLFKDGDMPDSLTIKLELYPNHFSTIENASNFLDGNKDFKATAREAINGCTKSAVYDGRIFLTGNQLIPNTVFYSQRNLTGMNDPTYFGAYNYFNDGVGNTPNVDLLSTPSYLMVLKKNTIQDGSIYYHVGADNPTSDSVIANLLPRIYPSTSGAAGIGSAADSYPGTVSCNFLDDAVFLSTRGGLEAVGKETLNLERTLTHRSSNVDRKLSKENLARAAIAEWKGYLFILCNGNAYLADSRSISQHADGSYQYEWFILSGLGAYEEYVPRYRYLNYYPFSEEEVAGITSYKIREKSDYVPPDAIIETVTVGDVVIYSTDGYLVEQSDGEMLGAGNFFGADKVLNLGDRLYLGTANGYILCINTDMRDADGLIPQDYYTFNNVAYESGCATRLDDCGTVNQAKCTIPGTVTGHFKMMPGSCVNVNVSLNGRDFKPIYTREIPSSRFDFNDFNFGNLSFGENESHVATLHEMTRSFIHKQYYVYSDGYKQPFGLYGIDYVYYVRGKVRK